MNNWTIKNCAVIGASGGLGSAFVKQLASTHGVERIWAYSRSNCSGMTLEKVQKEHLDYADPTTITKAAALIGKEQLDLVIVATGQLHTEEFGPEKSLKDLDAENLLQTYHVNAVGPALVAQSFLPLMRREEKSVFAAISARVGSISDNRMGGWYGYRAAKSALNQMLKTISIEHGRRWKDGVVIGLHPGTVDTGLSKPFQRNVAEGKLFTPEYSVSRMLNVIEQVNASQTGKVFAYDFTEVPA